MLVATCQKKGNLGTPARSEANKENVKNGTIDKREKKLNMQACCEFALPYLIAKAPWLKETPHACAPEPPNPPNGRQSRKTNIKKAK
jgi:hypothetical protein